MQARHIAGRFFERLANACRYMAGSMYPDGHPLHEFHHDIAATLSGASRKCPNATKRTGAPHGRVHDVVLAVVATLVFSAALGAMTGEGPTGYILHAIHVRG